MQRVYTATIDPGAVPGPRSMPTTFGNGLIGASATVPLTRSTSRSTWRPPAMSWRSQACTPP